MKASSTVLFYCQHSLGIGHLQRSLCVAAELAKTARVVFLNGGPIPPALPRPRSIEFIDLPPLGMGKDRALVSRIGEYSLNAAQQLRKEVILRTFEELAPTVIFIELFPFGRKKFAFELLPLLRAARRGNPPSKIICSVRDILVDRGEQRQLRHDNRARWLLDRYFDAVIVHTDAQFCELGESFKPQKALATPLFYSGFVSRAESPATKQEERRGIVVSAGGGMVGGRLLRACAQLQARIWRETRVPMTLVAGPFLPEPEWLALQDYSGDGLTLYRSVLDLRAMLRGARASISQGGYNTVMDVLATRCPALLVPYHEGQENEQLKRATKLADLDVVQVLPEQLLSAETLYPAIKGLLNFTPSSVAFAMNGAATTVKIVARIAARNSARLERVQDNVA